MLLNDSDRMLLQRLMVRPLQLTNWRFLRLTCSVHVYEFV